MFDADKEGGYGWCVALSSSLLHAVVCGIAYSCGVTHLIFRNYFNHPTHFVTSWISTVMLGMCVLAGIPGTLLTYKIGYRPTVILGGLIAAGGMATSMFCTEYYQVLLSFGAMSGLGFGLALAPSIMVLENYFFVKRPMAISVAVAGAGAGLTILPVASYYLEEEYAWKGMAMLFTGLCLNICLCGAAMRPKHKYRGKHRKALLKIFESGLCQSSAFVALCIVNFLWSFGSVIVYMYLPGYAVYVGQDVEYGVVLIGIVGLSSFLSRPMFQLFTHSAKLDHTSIILCSLGISAILTGLHPEMFLHKAGQIGYCILFGLHTGFWTTFIAHITGELIGEEFVAYGRGFTTVCIAMGLIGGGPLAGWVLDEMDEDYEIIFYLAGACMLLSSSILALVNIKKCFFRPMADWCDSDSESSASSFNKNMNTCTDEEIALMTMEAAAHDTRDAREVVYPCFLTVTPSPGSVQPTTSTQVGTNSDNAATSQRQMITQTPDVMVPNQGDQMTQTNSDVITTHQGQQPALNSVLRVADATREERKPMVTFDLKKEQMTQTTDMKVEPTATQCQQTFQTPGVNSTTQTQQTIHTMDASFNPPAMHTQQATQTANVNVDSVATQRQLAAQLSPMPMQGQAMMQVPNVTVNPLAIQTMDVNVDPATRQGQQAAPLSPMSFNPVAMQAQPAVQYVPVNFNPAAVQRQQASQFSAVNFNPATMQYQQMMQFAALNVNPTTMQYQPVMQFPAAAVQPQQIMQIPNMNFDPATMQHPQIAQVPTMNNQPATIQRPQMEQVPIMNNDPATMQAQPMMQAYAVPPQGVNPTASKPAPVMFTNGQPEMLLCQSPQAENNANVVRMRSRPNVPEQVNFRLSSIDKSPESYV